MISLHPTKPTLPTPTKTMIEREDHPRRIISKVTVGKGRRTMIISMSLKIRMTARFVLKCP
jgi:hypothetical protein